MATRVSRAESCSGEAPFSGVSALSSCSEKATPDATREPVLDDRAVSRRNKAVRADLALRDAAVSAESQLLERCAATVRRHPVLTDALQPLELAHRAHLRVLNDLWRSTQRRQSPPREQRISANRRTAVAKLRRAERRAVEARIADCVEANDGRLAQLLASIAASDAQHAEMLSEAR